MQQSQHWSGMRRMKYWTVPAGGYYIWVFLTDGVRSLDVLESCRSQGVTFMPGSVFDVDEMDDSTSRLNFVRPMLLTLIPAFESLARR